MGKVEKWTDGHICTEERALQGYPCLSSQKWASLSLTQSWSQHIPLQERQLPSPSTDKAKQDAFCSPSSSLRHHIFLSLSVLWTSCPPSLLFSCAFAFLLVTCRPCQGRSQALILWACLFSIFRHPKVSQRMKRVGKHWPRSCQAHNR